MRVGFVSRFGASPGYCVTTVASAKTDNPKIEVSLTTRVPSRLRFRVDRGERSCGGKLVRFEWRRESASLQPGEGSHLSIY